LIIDYRVIVNQDQRYPTAADYWFADDTLHVRVSETGNPRMNVLLALHELIEALFVQSRGEPDLSTDFDLPYEQARLEGKVAPCGCLPTENSEPGDDIHAPYHAAHQAATACERLIAQALEVRWEEYEAAVEKL